MQKRVRAWATVGVMAAGVLVGSAGLGEPRARRGR